VIDSSESDAPVEINAGDPKTTINRQIVDYYLWALQRLYERGEDRFLKLVWNQVGLIHDVDDTRKDNYGVYYTKKKQLTLKSLE
jgi:hypothetical protein